MRDVKSREGLTVCVHARGSEQKIEWGYKATLLQLVGEMGWGICHRSSIVG